MEERRGATTRMTDKERVLAALEGRSVDRNPVTVLYDQLYHRDHFEELTGEPQWQMDQWLHASPELYLSLYRQMIEKARFEILQPDQAPSRGVRENVEFVQVEGRRYRRDKRDGTVNLIADPISGHADDVQANQVQYVFDKGDVDYHVRIPQAEDRIASGANDYVQAVVAALGRDQFVMSGGVVGVLYLCSLYVGQTNLYALLIENPNLIDYLCHKLLEQNIETIRQLAASGGDAIYIDDAMTTSDMISVQHYERYSLPYMQEMVGEIHRLGQRAIVIYFGGIADRLEQIASIGADGLQMETSMKGYVNDIDETVRRIGNRVTLLGNLDPVNVLQNGTEEELEAEMRRQASAGRQGRGFIACTGSPITPSTPLSRVQRFVQLGRELR